MKIKVSDVVNVKKLPKGFHQVKIIEVVDGSIQTANGNLDYFDCIFHGSQGFIVSRYFNTVSEIEKIIALFKVCGVRTPLNYKISNLLLKYNSLVIQVDEKEDVYGDLALEVVGIYSAKFSENGDCNVPDGVDYVGSPPDLDWNEIYRKIINSEFGQILHKYKYL
jgi:hypothetical protein